MQNFLENVRKVAREHPARIVFPETFDDRTLRACAQVVREKTAQPILLGSGFVNPEGCTVVDFEKDAAMRSRYAEALFELRKNKGMTLEAAQKLMLDRNYFGVMMVQRGEADGLISGANVPSHDTLRPALQIIKTKEKFHKVSGFFFMLLEERLLLFADCMVNIEPSSEELAEIAVDTAQTARRFGIEPKVAMLSFSTAGSAKHPSVDRVREAVARVNHFHPEIVCEGEMQVDAALVPEICAKKFPASKIMGNANILIFPDLNSANIGYKLVERLARASAIGPILQGLQKPVNDLSRGCSVQDIVDLAAITSVEALELPVPGMPAVAQNIVKNI